VGRARFERATIALKVLSLYIKTNNINNLMKGFSFANPIKPN
jgi:hypothetical protein